MQKRYLTFSFKADKPKGGLFDLVSSSDNMDQSIIEARKRIRKGQIVQVFDCESRELVFEREG